MKTKQELLQMLYNRLAELQDGKIKQNKPNLAEKLKIELGSAVCSNDSEEVC